MPRRSTLIRAGAVAGTCAVLGAGAGIAGSAAAPSKGKKAGQAADPGARVRGGPGHGPGPGRAVHAQEVVLNRAGTAFVMETEDNGTVKSVSGAEVVIAEAAGGVAYKDVTVTIPGGARVMRNFATAAVGDLRAGDRIHVSQSSDGTFVFAVDAAHARRGPDGDGDGHRHGPGGFGPGGPDGPGDPPPPGP